MARGIGSRVPKTSGQGVSRFSYAKGYALGNKGRGSDYKTGTSTAASKRGSKASKSKSGDNYGDYGPDTLPLPPPKSDVPDKRQKPKQYTKGK